VTATKSWGPTPTETVGTEVDYQVAAPLKREHPTCTERISLTKSADGRMATEAARLKRKNPLGGKRKTDLTLTGLLMEGLGKLAHGCSLESWKGRSLSRLDFNP